MVNAPTSRTRAAAVVAAAVVLIGGAAACSPPGDQQQEDLSHVDDGIMRIGVVGAFSGDLSYVGNAVEGGVRYAVDERNDAGGSGGRDVEIVTCDGQFQPSTERNCLTKLVSEDHVDAIVLDDPQLPALDSRFVANLDVPVMLPVIAPPTMDPTTLPNAFAYPPRSDSPDVLAAWLAQKYPGAPVGIIAADDSITDIALADVKVALEKAGLHVAATERFSAGDADLTPQTRALQSAGATVMVPLALGADAAHAVQAADRIGYHPQVAGTETLYMSAYRELAGPLSNDTVLTLPHGADQTGVSIEFLQWLFDYFRRYGVRVLQVNGSFSPDYPGLELLSYEMTDAVLEAADDADTTEPDAVVRELQRPSGYAGVGRRIKVDPSTNEFTVTPEFETWIARFKNGHVLFDWDPRSAPALEEARYAVEEWFLADGKVPELNVQTVVDLAQKWVDELTARKDAAVAQMGQARYDDLLTRSQQGLELARLLAKQQSSGQN